MNISFHKWNWTIFISGTVQNFTCETKEYKVYCSFEIENLQVKNTFDFFYQEFVKLLKKSRVKSEL